MTIGQSVVITDRHHPWRGEFAEVTSLATGGLSGWLSLRLADGRECAVAEDDVKPAAERGTA